MAGLEIDYAGCKFNSLTVIRQTGRVLHGRNYVKIWLCACICGNELKVDQGALVKGQKPACKTCRRGPCVICGAPIENDEWGVKRSTCSEACQRKQTNNKHSRRYYRLIANNPDHNKEHHRARSLADPLYEQKRYRRRLARLNRLPEEPRQSVIKKQNEYVNLWKSNYVKNLKLNDHEKYLRYRAGVNAYFRRWYKLNLMTV